MNNTFTQALDRARFSVDANRALLVGRFAAIQEGSGFWGAARWAAQYSLTAAAIAFISIICAFLVGAQYAYAIGAVLGGYYYASRRSASNLLLLPVAQPVRLLPAAPLSLAEPATVKALPAAKGEPAQRGRKPALTTEQKQALCQRRRDGASYEVLCAEFGVSKSTVKRSLRAA